MERNVDFGLEVCTADEEEDGEWRLTAGGCIRMRWGAVFDVVHAMGWSPGRCCDFGMRSSCHWPSSPSFETQRNATQRNVNGRLVRCLVDRARVSTDREYRFGNTSLRASNSSRSQASSQPPRKPPTSPSHPAASSPTTALSSTSPYPISSPPCRVPHPDSLAQDVLSPPATHVHTSGPRGRMLRLQGRARGTRMTPLSCLRA